MRVGAATMFFYVYLFLLLPLLAASLQPTETPPLLDSPVYSMATKNEDGTTNMNIVTYATPVSVRPARLWSLGLYKETKSYKNFVRTRSCVLQLLTEDDHTLLVRLLGGTSGKDVDKRAECLKLGCEWVQLNDNDNTLVLPNCVSYLKLSAIGELVDAGSHAVAICQVEEMLVEESSVDGTTSCSKKTHLSTAQLRELGIITEQGRVAD